LEKEKDNQDDMELVLEQDRLNTKDERDHVNRLEKKLVVSYEKIPQSDRR
jgi:hypothetical protein